MSISETDDLDAFIAAGARLMGLTVRPEWREAIRLHLSVSLAYAKTVDEFPLSDETDPAAVFSA
jgi:1-carboxybiuret hydrolase subunit AtzG-like protein